MVTEASVRRVVLDEGGRRATGVEWEDRGTMRRALARSGVVLCAGALETPRLLLLSGIGPGPLERGHVLHAGAWKPPLGDHLVPIDRAEVDRVEGGGVALRVVPGKLRQQPGG